MAPGHRNIAVSGLGAAIAWEVSGLGAGCCLWAALQCSSPNTQTIPVSVMMNKSYRCSFRIGGSTWQKPDRCHSPPGEKVLTIERTLRLLAVEVASIALEVSEEMAANRGKCCSNCRSALVGGCKNANTHKER